MGEFQEETGRKNFVKETAKKFGLQVFKPDPSNQGRMEHFEKMNQELQEHIRFLENETREMMESLEKSAHEFEILKRKYYNINEQLQRGRRQNERLVEALSKAREHIESLKQEIEKLCSPPNAYGTFKAINKDGTIDIDVDGRSLKVNVHPSVDVQSLVEGQQLILNEAYNVIEAAAFKMIGEVVTVKELLEGNRALVEGHTDDEKVIHLGPLKEQEIRVGDDLLLDPRSNYAYEKLPKSKVEEVMLEEVPNVTYDDIGGLDRQIEELRDGIELPYIYPEEFAEHQLSPPKGILLYGPPGCGKTLIAKAVANNLAKRMEEKTGERTVSYFLNVKGPELLNKFVGETESKIREVFKKAKEKANRNTPVIIFFDEMDSLFRVRGSGVSSDMEITVVSQFLAEIDGLESLKNVIIIGASNRQDLIDPAVLRPGRLDLKIKIDRPNREASKEIFYIYLKPELPLHEKELAKSNGDRRKTADHLINETVEMMFAKNEENKFLEVTYAKGEKETFYFKDFVSGAMIENIVARAKKNALKRFIEKGEKGIALGDLREAVAKEYKENEDLPNTTNPDDWAKISGRKGERIVNIRTLFSLKEQQSRPIEDITSGQYL